MQFIAYYSRKPVIVHWITLSAWYTKPVICFLSWPLYPFRESIPASYRWKQGLMWTFGGSGTLLKSTSAVVQRCPGYRSYMGAWTKSPETSGLPKYSSMLFQIQSGSSVLWRYTLQPTNRGPRLPVLLCRMSIRQEVRTSSSKYTNVRQRLPGNRCLSRCITSLMQPLNDARNMYGITKQSVNCKGSLRSLIRIISSDVRAVSQTWEGELQISSQRNRSEDSSLTQASMRLAFQG